MPRSRPLDARLVRARISTVQNVYDTQLKPSHMRLEEAVAGRFPDMMGEGDTATATRDAGYYTSQFNLNLMLPAQQFMLALAYDAFPSLRFSRAPDLDIPLARMVERGTEALMDEGGAIDACRDAMRSGMTRGPWTVWLGIGPDRVSGMTLLNASMPVGDLILAASQGAEVHPQPGMDYQALAAAARAVLAHPDHSLSISDIGRARLTRLAQEADKALYDELNGLHPLRDNRRLWYQVGRFGTDTLWDLSVIQREKRKWMARRIVLTPEEFDADPVFSDAAKRNLSPVSLSDGNPNYAEVSYEAMSDEDKFVENCGHVIWEYWDAVRWERHYVGTVGGGYDEFLEADEGANPYTNENGRPIFPDFFPAVTVVPIEHNREVATRTIGIPQLEPGLVAQNEAIKTTSAYLKALKQAGRFLLLGPGVDDEQADEVAIAPDMTVFRTKKNLSGENAAKEAFIQEFKASPAPTDFLTARQMVIADFGTQVSVTVPALTGQAQEPTLGQEQMAAQGASARQADIVRIYEGGFAQLAMKSLILARTFMPQAQLRAIFGKAADEVVTDEQGVPVMVEPMRPMTLWDKWLLSDITTRRMVARFASSTRAEDAVTLKQLDDYVALANTVRDMAGFPLVDLRTLLLTGAKYRDIDVEPYKPSAAEVAQMMAQAAAQAAPPGDEGGEGPPSGGGDASGRTSRNGRGPAPVPGRQSRGRAPQSRQNMDGAQNRASGARA